MDQGPASAQPVLRVFDWLFAGPSYRGRVVNRVSRAQQGCQGCEPAWDKKDVWLCMEDGFRFSVAGMGAKHAGM